MSLSERPARWYLIQTKPRQEARAEEHLQRQINDLWRTIPKSAKEGGKEENARCPAEPQ